METEIQILEIGINSINNQTRKNPKLKKMKMPQKDGITG